MNFNIEIYRLCLEAHNYLEEKNIDTLYIPSMSWWQKEKKFSLIKKIRNEKTSFQKFREIYTTTFIRSHYRIKKR